MKSPEIAATTDTANTFDEKKNHIDYEGRLLQEILNLQKYLPQQPPSFHDTRPLVTLSELPPGKYVDVVARIVFLRTIERIDSLGKKMIFSGILEDSTYKVPFISHKIGIPLSRNSIYKFQSVYVHEFEKDKSIMIVAMEHSKIEPRSGADGVRDFVWNPKISSLKRPVKYISLQGIITTIYSNSGLIKRCNKCSSIIPFDAEDNKIECPNKCPNTEGWGWDFRISGRLYDGSGSVRVVLTRELASKVMKKNLSELMMLANVASVPEKNNRNNIKMIHENERNPFYEISTPNQFEVIEAVTENANAYRKSDRFIVTDTIAGSNLVFLPLNEDYSKYFSERTRRMLQTNINTDFKIIRRLLEKALDIQIRQISGRGMLHGMFLVEAPSVLYNCERAKLYCGFGVRLFPAVRSEGSINNHAESTKFTIEIVPQCLVRESVLDYIIWRRSRGATDKGITKALTQFKNKVIVAPSGRYGLISELVMQPAGSFKVSDIDSRTLVQFWKDVYDIDIDPDEMPLLKIKLVNNSSTNNNSEQTFTYPPSMCFFGSESLFIQPGVQKFISYKKSALKSKVEEVVEKALSHLQSDNNMLPIRYEGKREQQTDIHNLRDLLEAEIREMLYGRNIRARGSVLMVHDEPWFFPNHIDVF